MNAINEQHHDDDEARIEAMLTEAATTFQPPAEEKARARRALMKMAAAKPQAGIGRGGESRLPVRAMFSRLRWPLAGAASAALAAVIFLAVILWPTPLTMAQVREAVEGVEWVHVEYDNGEEHWIAPNLDIFARIDGGTRTLIDYRNGIDHRVSSHGTSIYERTFEPRTKYGRSAWEAVIGSREEGAEDSGPDDPSGWWTERHTENDQGRRLVRFDTYHVDALGQTLLIEQLWADPASRLPVRMRERLSHHEREDDQQQFSNAVFSFPATGPESIYDLGIPRDTPIVRTDGHAAPREVTELIASIEEAMMRFPAHYRVVRWDAHAVYVAYWGGKPIAEEVGDGTRLNYGNVKYRRESFLNCNDRHPDHHLPLPATAEEVLEWTATQPPYEICIADSERTLDLQRPGPAPPLDEREMILIARRQHSYLQFTYGITTVLRQWELAPANPPGGPIKLLPEGPDGPPGTVGLRLTIGDDRWDYHIDPEHDHICVKRVGWRMRDGHWTRESEAVYEDLVRLPTGHWVATGYRSYTWGEDSEKPDLYQARIDVTVLAPDDFPPDTFNGEKLLEEAKKIGATIETY